MGNRSFLAAWSAFALVFFGCSSCGEKRMPASRTEAFAENGRRNLTLIFTGDLMQHMPQVFAARQRDGSFDYTSCFSRLNNYFSSADFVIANLETTLGEEPYSGYPRFRSPEALAGAMRRAGVDVAVLANNHICDRGAEGIRSTLAALDEAGLLHTGAFADSVPPRERHPLMLEKEAFRVALLNYTYGTNGLPVPSRVSRKRHRHDDYSPRDRLGPAGWSHSCRAVRSLGKRVRATARPPSARAGGGFPPLGRRSGDRIASACRAAGGNDRGFGRKRTRGDGLLDGQFRVEPAFPGYGRRPVGPRDVDARRTGPDILPPGVLDRLDLHFARPEQRLRPSLRYRAELLARNGRAPSIATLSTGSSSVRAGTWSVTAAALRRYDATTDAPFFANRRPWNAGCRFRFGGG